MDYENLRDDPLSGDTAAYFILFLQGMGNLFPWNSMITAAHYFTMRFCGTPVQYNFESYFAVITMLSQAVGLALVMQYLEKYPLKYCVLFPIVATTAIMIVTATLVLFSVDAETMFQLSVFFCAVIGLSSAVSGGGLFGLSGCLPPKYTGALMSGQALGGIVVSICSLVTIAMGPAHDLCIEENTGRDSRNDEHQVCTYDVDYSTFTFFSIAALVLLLCILSFIALLMLPFTMYHQEAVTRDLLRGMSLDELSLTFLLDETTINPTAVDSSTRDSTSLLPMELVVGVPPNEVTPLVDKSMSVTSVTSHVSSARSGCKSAYSSFDHFVELDAAESPMQHFMARHYDKHTHTHANLPTHLNPGETLAVGVGGGEEDGLSDCIKSMQIRVCEDSGSEHGYECVDAPTGPMVTPPRVAKSSASPYTPIQQIRQNLSFPLSALTSCVNPRILSICTKIRSPAVAVFLTLMCTLTIFPSTVVRLRSEYVCGSPSQPYSSDTLAAMSLVSRLNADLFVPVMFVFFNISDFVGRILAGFNDFGILPQRLPSLAISRFAIVPLLMLCRLSKSSLPLVFSSDLFPIAFMMALGLSNGFLSTLAMVTFPTMVSPRKVAQAGNVMILALNVGLLCGAIFSFPVLYMSTSFSS